MPQLPQLNIFEKMRGIFTPITAIRRKVLVEVAKMIVTNQAPSYIESIPYLIISKNTPTYRDCVFQERAIVRERVRLAFGLDLKEFGAHAPIIDDLAPALVPKKVIKAPIVNVIKIGCERCPTTSYFVSNICAGCIAHPCLSVCPKNAVSMVNGKSFINQETCIRCGRCAQVCPYNAIHYRERPCAAACGVDAIRSDSEGYAEINYEKCVSCGLCIVSCPFGAIAEKSEIVQVLKALKNSRHIYAEIAPSFAGQFGPLVTPEKLFEVIKKLGFAGMVEVAFGADIDVIDEVKELMMLPQVKEMIQKTGESCFQFLSPPDSAVENKNTEIRTFVGTSCCPSWVMAAQRAFPDMKVNISESYTPMVETAKKIKAMDPEGIVVFIGPCIAKKMECFHPVVSKYVDFVITFEEFAAMFGAMNIDPTTIEAGPSKLQDASAAGRNFAVAKGVSLAVLAQVKKICPKLPAIPAESADTLKNCLALLKRIANKQINPVPLLVEGMACPNGCIGGPGTLAPLRRAQSDVMKFANASPWAMPSEHIQLDRETKPRD